MSQQTVTVGSAANDGTGDPIRTAFQKVNANFTELYADLTGAVGRVPTGAIVMWSGSIATIPANWALCDGAANAPGPDLRDRFVVGAKQDVSGTAKSNIEGSLKQTGGVTGVSHSAHANLVHAGGAVADHTGLTHGITIADHPDLTHAAITFNAQTLAHGDHAIASFSGTAASRADLSRPSGSIASHAAGSAPSGSIASRADLSMPSGSIPSRADLSVPSGTIASNAAGSAPSGSIASRADLSVPSHTHASAAGVSSFATSTNRSGLTALPTISGASANNASMPSLTIASANNVSVPSGSVAAVNNATMPSLTFASHAVGSLPSLTIAAGVVSIPSQTFASGADVSMPSITHSHAAVTLTHDVMTVASQTKAIADHKGTAFGVHAVTAPAAHGTAGTVSHAFTQPNDHAISAHDTVLSLPNYFALAFIQRMA